VKSASRRASNLCYNAINVDSDHNFDAMASRFFMVTAPGGLPLRYVHPSPTRQVQALSTKFAAPTNLVRDSPRTTLRCHSRLQSVPATTKRNLFGRRSAFVKPEVGAEQFLRCPDCQAPLATRHRGWRCFMHVFSSYHDADARGVPIHRHSGLHPVDWINENNLPFILHYFSLNISDCAAGDMASSSRGPPFARSGDERRPHPQ